MARATFWLMTLSSASRTLQARASRWVARLFRVGAVVGERGERGAGSGVNAHVRFNEEREAGAFANLTANLDVSVHHVDEPLCNRQTQARSAIAARGGRIRLRKVGEEPVQNSRVHADTGICHLEVQANPIAIQRLTPQAQAHPSGGSKFHARSTADSGQSGAGGWGRHKPLRVCLAPHPR